MNTNTPQTTGDAVQALARVRHEIDRIDNQMIGLIAERLGLVRTVAQQKIQQGLVFRARREIEKIRVLQQLASQHAINQAAIFDIWRILMSHAAYQQRPFRLLCLGGSALADIARGHFGQDIEVNVTNDLDELLRQQQAEPDNVMCLIDQQYTDWWQEFADIDNFQIVAELPWRGDAKPQAFLAAHCPIDLDAGADILCILTLTATMESVERAMIEDLFDRPIVSMQHDQHSQNVLVRFHDTGAHETLENMFAQFTRELTGVGKSQWLARLPVFHQQ